nr:membrane protein insertase YidC [Armatimonadota bacterium]NIM23375.1 membrane protein insertase YidC [Armatimonadota bacterium]NIM67239.1 membrane protein insertase YidC [Armatimonadota bacterium]NIN05426.1 membrane protein insertase YidC [Armatimonadota bacterium]NIO96638.1 membrane protein insertase YidC [Armatimonadota bacterium]
GEHRKKLQKAIKAYQEVAGDYKGSEYAAEARLQIGIIYETKLQDEHQAMKTYRALSREFAPVSSKAAAEAETRLTSLGEKIDRRNSQKALYKFLDFFVALTGRHREYSYFLALVLVTALFKLALTPLSRAQFKGMKEMQKIQPLVKELQEKYKGNQKEFGEKLMALYKQHGVNPFSSCLPLLVQLPVLIMLYHMVRLYEFQFAKGHFLWIGSGLVDKAPTIVARNLADPDIPLLLLYIVSMFVSQKISIVDPSQAEQQKIMMYAMPILFAWIFRDFPSAFMLYWLIFNIMSTAQQYYIMKQPAAPGPGAPGAPVGQAPGQPPTPKRPGARRPSGVRRRAKRRRKRFDAVKRQRLLWVPCALT